MRKLSKRSAILIGGIICSFGCREHKKTLDVSKIDVPLQVVRFEKDLFGIDSNNLASGIDALFQKETGFAKDYFFTILGVPPDKDSVAEQGKMFVSSYRPVFEASKAIDKSFGQQTVAINNGLRYVKYYFPAYSLPKKLITFIGPFNGFVNIITPDNNLAVGLQSYMGTDYPVYRSEELQTMFPAYLSRRFAPEYIAVNSLKNIIDDIMSGSPNARRGAPLIEQIVEQGKKLYLLDALLPMVEDTLKTGYTDAQLSLCKSNEKNIWAFFVQSELLYQTDPGQIASFVNDGPKTSELGEGFPGDIGQYIGFRIVKKWMERKKMDDKQEGLSLLLNTSNKQVFEEAKYSP